MAWDAQIHEPRGREIAPEDVAELFPDGVCEHGVGLDERCGPCENADDSDLVFVAANVGLGA